MPSLLLATIAPGAVSARPSEGARKCCVTAGIGGTSSVLGFLTQEVFPSDGRRFADAVKGRVGTSSTGDGFERCLELPVDGVLLCEEDGGS